jgi:two-component system chemotaxis response regulator CheB
MAIKVLIIDDSALVRQTMSDVLNLDPEIKVIATASDPIFGVKKIQQERPDVIILDIEMARMDGLTFLKKLNATVDPIPVVVCSAGAEKGSANAVKALEYGACDVIDKPSLGTKKFIEESRTIIGDAVKAAYKSTGKLKSLIPSALTGKRMHATSQENPEKKDARPTISSALGKGEGRFSDHVQPKLSADVILEKPEAGNFTVLKTSERVVVVGASTGGTEALKDFLEMLPENAPGIVIVQHMPKHFTAAFAERLNGLCKITVKEAEDGDDVIAGRALIAPGDFHTLLKRDGNRYYVEVKQGPLVSRHRPSVDVLFRSAARYAGQNAVGIIMTGMGDDGAHGMKEMHDTGSFTIAQDEATCIVYGMPGEAVKLGGVDKIVPLPDIAKAMLDAVNKK